MTVVIVGLGVIGGGYAMALKREGIGPVYGVDVNPASLEKALEMGVIERGCTRGDELLGEADLTILALYPHGVLPYLREHRDHFRPGSLITDVTGVKSALAEQLSGVLPQGVDFVMGHPMAGREKKGIEFASDRVFQGANYLLTPMPGNTEEHLEQLTQLALRLGFRRVERISPQRHDEMIAFTSQLPHALAVALINSDREERDTGRFIGDSYRDLTRIANINGELWSELFLQNRENLIEVISEFERQLNEILEALLAGDRPALERLFEKSSTRRERLD